MARKKKSEAKAAAEAAIGHNKPPLTEDELRALTYHHKSEFEKAKAVLEAAKSALKKVKDMAKAECGKHAVADIEELIALEHPKGGEALKADIERKLKLARWANTPVGTQFTFDDADRAPDEDRAYAQGKHEGLKGAVKRPPFDSSLPQYARWCDGWNDGQAALVSAMKRRDPPIVDPAQIDLAERTDLPPQGQPHQPNNTADMPFHAPADDLDVRTTNGGALNRT